MYAVLPTHDLYVGQQKICQDPTSKCTSEALYTSEQDVTIQPMCVTPDGTIYPYVASENWAPEEDCTI